LDAFTDERRHAFFNTNNIWIDLRAVHEALTARGPVLGLPLIRNPKTVGPTDPRSPQVIQIETAMGAAIEVFEDSRTIEVGRDRFIPVKTTNDLLVLRSDVYDLGKDFGLDQASDVPYVELDPDFYQLVGDFDQRFPQGAPSLRQAHSLKVEGDFTFGKGVQVVGDVELESDSAKRIAADTVLDG